MTVELGIIEGFYGPPLWSWSERRQLVNTLLAHGYGFYLYAPPKADPYLRRRWQEPHPPEQAEAMADFARFCRREGVRFGIGLSPFETFNNFDEAAREALAKKLKMLDRLGIQELAILFDDMHPATPPDLARTQAQIVDWVKANTSASKLSVCPPTYYSDDPVLDRVFGQRPADYLETLGGAELDREVRIFWTGGEEVCSREVSPGHLKRVSKLLGGRKPLLWDNYPVNDGDRMSRHLHLRGFTGRPAGNAAYLSGHAINPALQPVLTTIPAITLAECYRQGGPDYQYGQAFLHAAREVLGLELAGGQLHKDLLTCRTPGWHASAMRKSRH